MRFLLLLLLLPLSASADTISRALTSATCSATVTTGCVTISARTASVSVQLSGTWDAVLVFEGSNDASAWTSLRGWPSSGGVHALDANVNGAWLVDSGGLLYMRVRVASYTSGTINTILSTATARPVLEQVDLNAATLAAIGTVTCGLGQTLRVALGTTATELPPAGADPSRSALTVRNVDLIRNVSCDVDLGGGAVPDCTTPGVGLTLLANGGSARFPTATAVKCVACTAGGAVVEYVEESCR